MAVAAFDYLGASAKLAANKNQALAGIDLSDFSGSFPGRRELCPREVLRKEDTLCL
jgi:hypothetical protein